MSFLIYFALLLLIAIPSAFVGASLARSAIKSSRTAWLRTPGAGRLLSTALAIGCLFVAVFSPSLVVFAVGTIGWSFFLNLQL